MPTSQAPPSSTISPGPNSSRTCAAVVGLTCPKRFALGLQENLAVLQSHIEKANAALHELATGRCPEASAEEE